MSEEKRTQEYRDSIGTFQGVLDDIKRRQEESGGRKYFDGQDPEIVLGKVQACWSFDGSDEEAGAVVNLCGDTISNCVKEYPYLLRQKTILQHKMTIAAKQTVAQHITEIDSAWKYLERRHPKEYAPLQKNANTDPEGNQIAPVFTPQEGKL